MAQQMASCRPILSDRQGHHLLHEKRRHVIQKNREKLRELIDIKGTILLDRLLSTKAITSENQQTIEAATTTEQVDCLLDILLTKTNHNFDEFCQALYDTRQVTAIQELVIDDDVRYAGQKLAEYYDREFTEISLYSPSGKTRVPLPKLYVPMTWRRCRQGKYEQEEELKRYVDILKKIHDAAKSIHWFQPVQAITDVALAPLGMTKTCLKSPDTRIVVDGVPGAGKTTFAKRLCYVWAQAIKEGVLDTFTEMFSEDIIVIPIILRFVCPEHTLLDILQSQLHFLLIPEIYAIMNLIAASPGKVFLVLDGYDEMTECKYITKLLTKEFHPNVLCLTTSRPHAIEMLRRDTSQAIDQHIQLCGFSEEQVKKYFKIFFKHHFGKETRGLDLISHIKEMKRNELMEVAAVPIRSEMICIVWAEYGRLGKTIADLYTLFVIHLLSHRHLKYTQEMEFDEENLLKQHHATLMKIGEVANRWLNKRLQIVFTTLQIQDHLDEKTLIEVIDIGLLIKSHPSSRLEKAQWSFPHLTIQEFMTAFYLANTTEDDVKRKFINMCRNPRVLKRCGVIFQFLCCKYPSAANEIISQIIQAKKKKVPTATLR